MKQESLLLLKSATADRSSPLKVSVARVSTVRSGRAEASVAVRRVSSVFPSNPAIAPVTAAIRPSGRKAKALI